MKGPLSHAIEPAVARGGVVEVAVDGIINYLRQNSDHSLYFIFSRKKVVRKKIVRS